MSSRTRICLDLGLTRLACLHHLMGCLEMRLVETPSTFAVVTSLLSAISIVTARHSIPRYQKLAARMHVSATFIGKQLDLISTR